MAKFGNIGMTGQKFLGKNHGPKFFIIFVLFGVFFAAGFFAGSQKTQVFQKSEFRVENTQPPAEISVDFSQFWDVWQRLTTAHLDRANFNPKKLVEGAISGLISATGDPYSAYLTPEQNAVVKQELAGIYEGVGIQIGVKNNQIVVMSPLSGTPAEVAGVRPGDKILKIDEAETVGMSLPQAVSLIRGPAGTKVRLTLQRGDQPAFVKELTRAKITVKSVEVKLEDKIAIVKLSRFGDNTNSEWDGAVSEILTAKPAGLILDLRNNPGGFLSGAVYVGQEFVGGRIVGQVGADGKSQFFTSQRKGKLQKTPMVVLVNGGTASAAEIVAGALHEKKRAKLIGEQTFGKGTVQDAQELAGGAGLHLTVAKWVLPTGKDINGAGLLPDIEIKLQDGETDNQVEKAKEILKRLI